MGNPIDFGAIKASIPLAEAATRYGVALRPAGRGEWIGLCPFHDERTPSFTISEAKGFYHCFGCSAHGDVVNFVARLENVSAGEAARRLSAGLNPRSTARARERADKRRQAAEREAAQLFEAARDIWRGCATDITGSIAERYLESRGLHRPRRGWPPSLRFSPALRWSDSQARNGRFHAAHRGSFPGLVAAYALDGAGGKARFAGIHRTYLDPSGERRAAVPKGQQKKVLGAKNGGAVRLTPAARSLLIGEGLETVLSVRQAMPRRAFWAATSLDRMAGLMLPQTVKTVTLLMDNDMTDGSTGPALVERARLHYGRSGVAVRVAWAAPGCDFNDMLLAG